MQPRRFRDAGQAFPIYITVVAGLLFLAFAYFAVGQAAAVRNEAQTAADAAALAAAQDARDPFRRGLLDGILDGGDLDDILGRLPFTEARGCAEAARFAAKNDAELTGGYEGCHRVFGFRRGYEVEVRTLDSVGDSVVPGTENQHATATAKAVIDFRCSFQKAEPDEETGGDGSDEGEDEDKKPVGTLRCDGRDFSLDPDDPHLFPTAADLFSVHLTD